MIKNIKSNITQYLAAKKFSRKDDSEKIFNKFFVESQEVLIVLPLSAKELSSEIIELIRFIAIHKKKLFFIHRAVLQQFLPNDFEYAALVVGETDKTKLGLPSKDLINRIAKYKFDLVIDLNIEPNLFASAISNIPKSHFRIGFVKKKSDLFYNYQIPKEINSEKSYRNLLNSLRMF
jgi:ADP-heptose:LPS heptosyltransferase